MAISTRKRRQRLSVLADHLEQVVKPALNGCKFDMDKWGTLNKANFSHKALDFSTARECGYEGCAMGWAITSPKLIKAGVRSTISVDDDGCDCMYCSAQADEDKRTFFDFDDAKIVDFFGIDNAELEYLFFGAGKGKRGVDSVVKKLREVAAKEV